MKTFKQFINESTWDQYVYHMTRWKFKPSRLKPWSHVGSLRAAMGMGMTKQFWPSKRTKSRIISYEFKPQGKGIEVKDRGGWAEDQVDRWYHDLTRKKVIPRMSFPKGTDPYDRYDIEHFDTNSQQRHITKELKKKGITHLYYKNSVEDPGSRSFVVMDPKELKQVHVFKGHPKFNFQKRQSKFTDDLTVSWFGPKTRRTKFALKSPTTSTEPYLSAVESPRRKWNTKEASSLRRRGWSYTKLGERYGVTASAVWKAFHTR